MHYFKKNNISQTAISSSSGLHVRTIKSIEAYKMFIEEATFPILVYVYKICLLSISVEKWAGDGHLFSAAYLQATCLMFSFCARWDSV